MIGSQERVRPCSWWCLFDSPLLLAAWATVVLGCVAVFDVGTTLQRAESVRRAAAPELARLAAETALAKVLGEDPSSTTASVRIGEVVVSMARSDGEFRIASQVGDTGVFRFHAPEVPGAAPGVFAFACSAVDPNCAKVVSGSRLIAPDQVPVLDRVQLAMASRGEQIAAFRLDQGIALLAWESGTEKPDYVVDRARIGDLDEAGGLVVLPGNLWIEVGEQALRFRLQRDLVVVVQGNLYVGRSIVVDGPGRLVLVTQRSATERSFADLDANGRWSTGDRLCGPGTFAGPGEGAGNVYLGLPGAAGAMRCDVGLVVAGELHLGAAARVAGPLVMAHGVTSTTAVGGRLEGGHEWMFRVDRERVPGFATTGMPRPGVLARVATPDRAVDQGLYLSAPAR